NRGQEGRPCSRLTQSRRRPRRPGVDRCPHCRGAGGRCQHGGTRPPELCRTGPGRRAGPQETRPTQPAADARWQGGSTPHRLGVLGASGGPRPLALAAPRRQTGRVGDCRDRLHRDHSPDAKKNELKPWLKEQWCIPPETDAEFVCAMEDVLEVYHRPYDEKRPLVCLDEASKQLIGETVLPLLAEPGQPERFDYEYVRNGTANLFMIAEPLLGWRTVRVTERRTAKDLAEVLRWLVEELHAEAEKVVVVMDNLNTHKLASLYEAFPPEQARRIATKSEI